MISCFSLSLLRILRCQVSEIILQEGEAFDFSLIMQLVSAFSDRPSSELKGFMCCMSVHTLALSSGLPTFFLYY